MRSIFLLFILLFSYGITLAQKELSSEEMKLVHQAPNSVMRVLQTTNLKDSLILRNISEPLKIDENCKLLAAGLLATVQDTANDGVGIAAPQVGINKQMFLMQRFDKENNPFQVVINPKITWTSNLIQSGREGCLSIPDTMGIVDRYYAIGVHYYTLEGVLVEEVLEGFTAIIFQHEFDHLFGILFLDRLIEQAKKQYHLPTQTYKWLSDKNTR
jgi:peptide deformylase